MFTLRVFGSDEYGASYEYEFELEFMPDDETAEYLAMGILFDNGWEPGTIEWDFAIDAGDPDTNEFLN